MSKRRGDSSGGTNAFEVASALLGVLRVLFGLLALVLMPLREVLRECECAAGDLRSGAVASLSALRPLGKAEVLGVILWSRIGALVESLRFERSSRGVLVLSTFNRSTSALGRFGCRTSSSASATRFLTSGVGGRGGRGYLEGLGGNLRLLVSNV